jgi:hypothetical protein
MKKYGSPIFTAARAKEERKQEIPAKIYGEEIVKGDGRMRQKMLPILIKFASTP